MSAATARAAGRRIAEHAARHSVPDVSVVLHGGEPLLLGPDGLAEILTALRAEIAPAVRLDLRIQTNAVTLTPAICDLFVKFGVSVGVSMDGDRPANDLHRRYANGQSSFNRVLAALALLRRPEYRRIYGGLLCTVDIRSDPDRVYTALREQDPPRIDFLLPHATWDSPPPGAVDGETPYADWLACIYDRWTDDGYPMPIRLFDSLRSLAIDGPSMTEWVGLDPVDLAVIETDGTWEQVDSLKTAYAGAATTGLDVFAHPIDEVAAHPGIARRRAGLSALSETCQVCPVVRQCGGGLLAHRFSTHNGFDNPSVYCADLKGLIAYMEKRPVRRGQSQDRPVGALLVGAIDQLGSGYGDADMLETLGALELSINHELVAKVYERAGRDLESAWEVLDGSALRVLGHPYVREWALRCLGGDPNPLSRPDYIANLAVATAIARGARVELPVTAHGAAVSLPAIGTVRIDPAADHVVIATEQDRFTVITPGSAQTIELNDPDPRAGWSPVRPLGVEGLDVALDDNDPFRDGLGWPPADPVTIDEADSWREFLRGAWESVQREVPGYSASLQASLRTITPLVRDPAGAQRSGSSRDAFGAVGVGPVPDADALAVLLVHEVQHVKFGALMDLCDLVDPDDPIQVRVGWRPDPRPIEAALTGAYAHLAVADVWRVRAAHGRHADAERQFRMYHEWVTTAVDSIERTRAYTDNGEIFLAAMRRTLETW
jgi:uncharacterized protein